MKMKLAKSIDKFYHDMAIAELRAQNSNKDNPNMTYNDMLYLDIIMGNEGKYSASQIADLLNVARPSVTQKINELEKKGYVRKQQSQEDKRVYYLYINEDNLPDEYLEQFKGVESKVFDKLLLTYTKNQIEDFCDMLSIIGQMYGEEIK